MAERWVAASDLVAAIRTGKAGGAAGGTWLTALEGARRAALDRTFVIRGGAEERMPTALITELEAMRRVVVHLTMRAMASNTSLESVVNRPDFARGLPAWDSALKSLISRAV